MRSVIAANGRNLGNCQHSLPTYQDTILEECWRAFTLVTRVQTFLQGENLRRYGCQDTQHSWLSFKPNQLPIPSPKGARTQPQIACQPPNESSPMNSAPAPLTTEYVADLAKTF
jgi:hypothetical protein